GKLIGLYGRRAMTLPPNLEEFRDALATGIVGLECFDMLDGIATPEGEERIATPFRPGLEASEGLAPRKLRRVLATEAPDRERRGQEFSAALFDLVKKSRGEGTLLRVL